MAGIFGDWQFNPDNYGGILGTLGPMMGQQLPAQIPGGFAPSGPAAAPQMPAIPPDAYAQAIPSQQSPQQAPQAPQQAPGLGIGDRSMAALANFSNAHGLLGALTGAITGATTGQRTDPVGLMLQQQAATYQALVQSGVPPAVARAAAVNNEVMKTVAPNIYTKPEFKTIKNALGEDVPIFENAARGTITYPTIEGGSPSTGGAPPGMLQASFDKIFLARNAGVPQDQLLQMVPNSLQDPVAAVLQGKAVPSNYSMRGQARDTMLKYAHAIDPDFDETTIPMRTEFARDYGNTKSGMGFRLEAGGKVLNHLEGTLDAAIAMHNHDVPSGLMGYVIPPQVIQAWNANKNNPAVQRQIATQMSQEASNMSLEKGRFLSGPSGGSVGEREKTVESYNPNAPVSNLVGAAQGDLDLFAGQYDSMNRRRDNAMGAVAGRFPIINADQQSQMDRIQKKIDILRSGGDLPAGMPTAPGTRRPGVQQQQQAGAQQSAPRITTQADYAKLPRGTQYLAPDGTMRTKQ